MGKLISDNSIGLFPLSTISDLVTFVDNEFLNNNNDEPNLALLSIVLGRIEQSLTGRTTHTTGSIGKKHRGNKMTKTLVPVSEVQNGINGPVVEPDKQKETNGVTQTHDFPPLEYDLVVGLYENFDQGILLAGLNQDDIAADRSNPTGTSKELIKNISDLFRTTLSGNYLLEKPHSQTIYNYVTGYRLDSFGLAIAVVAASQMLGLSDVHLVLSEDHMWVTFGKGAEANSTAEVTWHGKSTGEVRRGRCVDDQNSWLYLKGNSITCNRWMEMAAIISAINPAINIGSDSKEMTMIQKELLWKLHGLKHLDRYPMAIAHLADLEEIVSKSPTADPAKVCTDLYEESISINKNCYNNMHVYPYLYYGGYLYRHDDFKGALKYWSEAAQVISNYRYTVHMDEEIYMEFLDITKTILPSMMKKCSAGFSAKCPTRDPHCYANLIRFFDGICLWEEMGTTPVLHITWAKCWLACLNKFEWTAREHVKLIEVNDDEDAVTTPPRVVPSLKWIPIGQTPEFTDVNGNSKGSDIENLVDEDGNVVVSVYLRSFKMKSVKALLDREKFNQGTITLQITAQPTLIAAESHANCPIKLGGRSRGKRASGDDLTSSGVLLTKRRSRN